jgi:hypothetical protein
MKYILFCFFFFNSYAVSSQVLILTNYKIHSVEKRVEKSFKKYKRTYDKEITDSSLSYSLTDTLSRPATFIYKFDKNQKCKQQEVKLDCDSCLKILVQRHLKNSFERWKFLSDGRFYAPFPYYTVMEVVLSNNEYRVRFTATKKKEIDHLLL